MGNLPNAWCRLKTGGKAAFVRKQCKEVDAKLRKCGTGMCPEHLKVVKTNGHATYQYHKENCHKTLPSDRPVSLDGESRENLKQLKNHRALQRWKASISFATADFDQTNHASVKKLVQRTMGQLVTRSNGFKVVTPLLMELGLLSKFSLAN